MFIITDDFTYKYAPILSISPAEMNALEELPDKDKDNILPIIPLRGWVGSKRLENSKLRVEKAIGDRTWIVDIDASFLLDDRGQDRLGEYPREVFLEIEQLLQSKDGYENWFQYLKDVPKAIPTLQLADLGELELQIEKLSSLGRGLVTRFSVDDINSNRVSEVLGKLLKLGVDDVLVVLDYGQVDRDVLILAAGIVSVVQSSYSIMPAVPVAISCSSFPKDFSGEHRGENPIYERQIFDNVSRSCPEVKMVYSDRGGARAVKIGGGGGIPSPRIDFPLRNDWRFIREEFEDSKNPAEGEREALYTKVARKIMESEYWMPDLHIWGTQVIEFTSQGDRLGISSPTRATAVRISIHMHQQLYYSSPVEDMLDTDEDWED